MWSGFHWIKEAQVSQKGRDSEHVFQGGFGCRGESRARAWKDWVRLEG